MRKQIFFLLLLLAVSFVLTTSLVWAFEGESNPRLATFGDVVWWWVITSSTVGYGDAVPLTAGGRVAATIAVVVGIYLYTNFITLTADSIHRALDKERLGTAQVTAQNHIVLCEYTAFADELLQELHRYDELANREVVIVSELVSVNPYPQHYFVRGVPISPAALAQANIQQADYIFVFANVRFQEPDLKTLHTVARIQRLNRHARIFVEMHHPNSSFVQYLSRPVTVLDSRAMLESLLQHHTLNLAPHFAAPLADAPVQRA